MARSTVMKLALVALICMVMAVPVAQALTCGQVDASIGQCLNYVQKGGAIPPACCSGVRKLNSMAKSTPDRQKACECLKTIAGKLPRFNSAIATGLPGKCGVNIPYKISTSINCKTVK